MSAGSAFSDSNSAEVSEPLRYANFVVASDYIEAGVGLGNGCYLLEGGTVACGEVTADFGDAQQLAGESDMKTLVGVDDATDIVAGDAHFCVLIADGSVSCWGGGGKLGDGTQANSDIPVKAVGISDAVSISAAYYHTCALTRNGEVYCWGSSGWGGNDHGQLGNGSYEASHFPTKVAGINDATFVSTGVGHTCAVHADGTISCWGDNEYGQLGDRSTTESLSPVKVLGVDDAKAVFPGSRYTCYIHLDSDVSCWGDGSFGIFRDGNSYFESDNPCMDYECEIERDLFGDTSYTPSFKYILLELKRIPGLSDVVSMSNDITPCATLADGTEQCWGCHPNYGGCREGHYPDEQEG